MQHRAHGKPVRALPRLWACYLMGRLGTDETGLNQTLPFAPEPGKPFAFMKGRCYPRKGVPPIFERITRKGHWPDQKSYGDPDDPTQKFNLLDRVECHLPGSKDWLFADQRSAALQLPLNQANIRQVLEARLGALSLQRMHPMSSLVMLLVIQGEDRRAMVESIWLRMASSADPAQVNVLMLLWQEALCQRNAWASVRLEQLCKIAVERLLERKELHDCAGCDELLANVRAGFDQLLLHIASSAVVGVQADRDSLRPECLIWSAPSEAAGIDGILRRFYWDQIQSFISSNGADSRFDALPSVVEDAVVLAYAHVLQAPHSLPGGWTRQSGPMTESAFEFGGSIQ